MTSPIAIVRRLAKRLRRSTPFGGSLDALLIYFLTSLVVAGGMFYGVRFVKLQRLQRRLPDVGRLEYVYRWDARRYLQIVERGYYYDPTRQSNIAFFPLFPLTAGVCSGLTGIGPKITLLLTSHAFLIGSFAVFAAYLRQSSDTNRVGYTHALLMFGLWPTTFFFRMSYAESTLLFFMLLTLHAMRRNSSNIVIALLAGAATAARPVGIALLLPLADHVWRSTRRPWPFIKHMAYLGPLACWGLAGFMTYQYAKFNEPLGFAKTQVHWHQRPLVSTVEKAKALAILEPIWAAYLPSSPAYWRRVAPGESASVSLQFANPLFFTGTCVLLIFGGCRGWLTRPELLLALGLILIPYGSRAYEMCMASQGRFTAVIFPIYIVLGHLLARMPRWGSAIMYAVCTFLLAAYAAHFAAGYFLI